MMETKASSPFRQSLLFASPVSAADSINVSNCGFSEELSRKVLTSLKALTESIGGVRESVAKIDRLAQAQGSGQVNPKLPAAVSTAALPGPPAGASEDSTYALGGGVHAKGSRADVLENALRAVSLSAAQTGAAAGWDDTTWETLRHVLDAGTLSKLEAYRSRPGSHVPPPPPPVVSFHADDSSDGDPDDGINLHAMSQGVDAFTREESAGVAATFGAQPPPPPPSVVFREGVDATASPPPGASRPSDPMDGDADWPCPFEEGPRFVAFKLRVVYEAGRTGFEEVRDFQAPVGTVIAGRYRVKDYLGSAAFSMALSCEDMHTHTDVCLKVIKNNKDFLDQSLDEIKLLRYINTVGDADEHNVLILHEYFYYKEHLILVTELLKDNLYEFQKYLMENKQEPYFTLPRLQRIAQQVLRALAFIHSKGLIHCDLKPENILIKSYSRCDVKVIDFGSSCFITDHLSTYIQSRSYRAPEVILGLPYDFKIDVWSLGCIMAELLTGKVLFQNDSVQTMLARMMGVIGDFPEHMMRDGKDVPKYFNSKGVVFERTEQGDGYVLLHPKKSSLQQRLKGADAGFLSFVEACLRLDPLKRPSAEEALMHPWFDQEYELEPYVLA